MTQLDAGGAELELLVPSGKVCFPVQQHVMLALNYKSAAKSLWKMEVKNQLASVLEMLDIHRFVMMYIFHDLFEDSS